MEKYKDLQYQKIKRNRDELLKHLKGFELDLGITLGVWYFNANTRGMHEPYFEKMDIERILEKISNMKKYNIKGIEVHYPVEINEDNFDMYKSFSRDTGISIYQISPQIMSSKKFEFGSFSNPDDKNRDIAIQYLIRSLEIARDINANHVCICPGSDGYLYPMGTVYSEMWDRFEDAVAQAMDKVQSVSIAIETKPYEPVQNSLYRTTGDVLLACSDIESKIKNKTIKEHISSGNIILGLQPEIGHLRMAYDDVACSFSRVARSGRLIHTHWNSQPLGSYDQDLNIGVVEWQQAEAGLYALKMIGYREYFGFDINPEHMDIEKAVEINYTVLNIMNERVNALPHEDILECYFNPEKNRGNLELLMAKNLLKPAIQ